MLGTRAVARPILAGNNVYCQVCDGLLVFRAKQRRVQVICNVYKGDAWDRVEHFHDSCYQGAGAPHGEVQD